MQLFLPSDFFRLRSKNLEFQWIFNPIGLMGYNPGRFGGAEAYSGRLSLTGRRLPFTHSPALDNGGLPA